MMNEIISVVIVLVLLLIVFASWMCDTIFQDEYEAMARKDVELLLSQEGEENGK